MWFALSSYDEQAFKNFGAAKSIGEEGPNGLCALLPMAELDHVHCPTLTFFGPFFVRASSPNLHPLGFAAHLKITPQ